MEEAKAIVLLTKRAAEMTGMREGEWSRGVWIRFFDSDAAVDGQERTVDEALTQAARLGGGFVLVAIGLPRVPETQVPAVRERIAKLVKAIQERARELGEANADRALPNRVRIIGVYQTDSPPSYVMDISVVQAKDFPERLDEILSALTELMPVPRSSEQGAVRLRLSSQRGAGVEHGASASAPLDERKRTEEPGPSSDQPSSQPDRVRIGQQGPSAQHPASDVPPSPSRLSLKAETEADEGATVLVVSRDRIPTVAIRFPIQINQDGMPDVGSRHFRELEDRLQKELKRRRITIPPGSPILGIGTGSRAIFRLVTYQELEHVGSDVLVVIFVDETTEHEAAYTLSRMGTKPQDAVMVVYAGSNPSFLSYVSSIHFRHEAVRSKVTEAVARAAASMLAWRIPDVVQS